MLMLRIVALALASATAQAQDLTPGLIAGYQALTEVDDYLKRDLVQKELERLMEDEDCVSFEAGRKFYYNIQATGDKNPDFPDGGEYLATIPTYSQKQSKEYKEYIQWAGGGNPGKNFHKQWVNAAFNKGTVSKGEMVADFTVFPNDPFCPGTDCECVGFEEVVKKATSYVYNFLEVVQLMQASIESAKNDECIYQQDSCEDAVKLWDASVAIYVGSLEGKFGRSKTTGKSSYTLANKRCRNFKNCGAKRNEGNSKDRISPVNTKVLAYFSAGQHAAFAGDYALMEDYKKLISAKMVVPWIQGTLRYAWRLSSERSRLNDSLVSNTDPLDASGVEQQDPKLPSNPIAPPANDFDYSVLDKEVGEAAAFALGAVPKLWACDVNAAKYVWSQLGPGQGRAGAAPVNFQLVKLAFECNYKCLLTSCDEVGALYDGEDKDGEINPGDSDDTIDGKVDVKNGAKKCNDNQLGFNPKGYAKCKNIPNSIRNGKCKFLRGTPGIGSGKSARDKLEYFQTAIP